MLIRVLAILTLVLAGVPRVGDALAGTQPEVPISARAACCEPVVIQTCCGETIEVARPAHESCPITGGECVCMAAPIRAPQPTPQAPMPRAGTDLLLGQASKTTRIEWDLAPRRLNHQTSRHNAGLSGHRTHNQSQALLGIWTT